MIIYDENTIAAARWPDTEEGRYAQSYLTPLVLEGTTKFFSDATTLRVVAMDDLLIPIAINEAEHDNSTNMSTFARYIRLPRAGISQVGWHPAVATLLGGALDGLGGLLKALRIDKCVYVGCWVILRNMEPMLTDEQVRRLTAFLVAQFPGHAVVFAALNPMTHHGLLTGLARCGYSFMFAGHTRMLMPYNAPVSRQERENRRRDAKLLQDSGYEIIGGEEVDGIAPRLAELYKALNRDKYSTNPMVNAEFFARAIRDKSMTIRMAQKDGRIDGFYGYMVHADVLFSPVFGYEMSVPQDVGLYRMLVYRLVQDALDLGLAIETGGGADKFKSVRGDSAVPRYGAFQVQHLPAFRRAAWKVLQTYANGPFMSSIRAYLRTSEGGEVSGFDAVPHTFTAPPNTPRQAVSALREEICALRRAIDEATTLEGEALARRKAVVSEKLNNWPQPTRMVEELKESLARLEQRARQQRKAQEEKSAASSLEAAHALLEGAERRGEVALVVGELHGASAPELRAAASAVLRKAPSAAIFFAAAHGGKAVLLAAVSPHLLQQGLEAGALMAAVAPVVGGKGGGGREMAFGGGPRPSSIPEALAAARRHLDDRLTR